MQQIIKTNAWETAKQINQQQLKTRFDNISARPTIIAGKNKIGDPNITSLHANVLTPNVHSALCMIENSLIPIGGILMTADNIDPAGIGTTERLTIELPKMSIQNEGQILIYGMPVSFEVGESVTTVTSKIADKIQLLIEDELGIDKLYRPIGTQNILDVTYIDRSEHQLVNIVDETLGLEIKGEVLVSPLSGYGTWDKIGVNSTLVEGTELSIWRRIA